MTVLTTAVILVSAAGVIAGALVGLAARSLRAGVASMLELWTAAALWRLTEDASWTAIGTAGTLVAVRAVLGQVFRAPWADAAS
jgi:hypothetical protein